MNSSPGLRRTAMVLAMAVASGALTVSPRVVSAQGGGMGWGRDYWMPFGMHRRFWDPRGMSPEMRARMQRHWAYMHRELPPEYEGARSTVPNSVETIAEGGELYAKNCTSCHGKTGLGDGNEGNSLTPSPALLAYLIQRPMGVDEYLLWTISEGGKAYDTAMPAFRDTLKRDEIWKIIAFMRAGFPETAADARKGSGK